MNIKLFNIALGLALSAVALNANAQKNYTQGIVSYTTEMGGQTADVKQYFTADSSAMVMTISSADIRILSNAKRDYFAVVLDVPEANMKKAGIATPAEIEEGKSKRPQFTFTSSTETKQIAGFNCKKVVAKNEKSGKSYDIWITNDITVPSTAVPVYYEKIGGFPVQFTSFQQGQETTITISGVSGDKAPAGTFAIGKDFEKGSLADLNTGG